MGQSVFWPTERLVRLASSDPFKVSERLEKVVVTMGIRADQNPLGLAEEFS